MSTRRTKPGGWARKKELVKGPNGRNLCRCGCGVECAPPRRTFASDECVHGWKLKTDPGYLRNQTFQRDAGVCARCGLDTETIRAACRRASAPVWNRWGPGEITRDENIIAMARNFMERGFPSPRETWWHADHIVEVAQGGGECDLSNIQTLCVECHKAKTKRFAAERAKAKRIAERITINTTQPELSF